MLYALLLAIGGAVAAPPNLAQSRTLLKRSPGAETTGDLYCPKASDIFPCSCLHTGAETATVRCYEIRPTTDFQNIFRLVSRLQISSLTIAESSLDHLPVHVLTSLDVNELHLSRIHSTRFSFFNEASRIDHMPKLFDSLYAIDINQATGIDRWDWSGFQRFRILDQVVIRNSSFPRLTKSFGSLPNTVKTIHFDSIHDMDSIAHGALARLLNLETLKISNTPLQTIERNALPRPAPQLTVLDLSNNELSYMSHDMFTEMPNLTVLSLEGNKLTSLASTTFAAINFTPKFRLYLMRNPFNCDCNIAWLNILYKKSPAIFGNDLEMTCYEPTHLKDEFLHALETNDFQCSKTHNLLTELKGNTTRLVASTVNTSSS